MQCKRNVRVADRVTGGMGVASRGPGWRGLTYAALRSHLHCVQYLMVTRGRAQGALASAVGPIGATGASGIVVYVWRVPCWWCLHGLLISRREISDP